MLRRLRKKTLIVVERGLEAFELFEETAAFDQLLERARLQHDDSIERRQRAIPVGRVEVEDLQVTQHPRQDVPCAARFQHGRIQLDRLPVDLREARANLVEGENLAADERIDDKLAALVDRLDQEMSRERHPKEIDAKAAADLKINHRERDRNSEASIDHVVEK